MKILKYNNFHSRKCIWKRLENGRQNVLNLVQVLLWWIYSWRHKNILVSFPNTAWAKVLENLPANNNHMCIPYSPFHGPLSKYVNLRVAHARGMPRTFSLPPTSKETASWRSWDASRHVRDARAVMHPGIANRRLREIRSRHSPRIGNPQIYVSGKRPIARESAAIYGYLYWD